MKKQEKLSDHLRKISLIRISPFIFMHVACLGVFFVPFEWKWIWLAVGLYYLRMFGITAGFHRYFAHKSFKTSRVFQFILAILGLMAVQKGHLWWAAHHRVHHRYSGQENDIHSPEHKGFWWSHMLWILVPDNDSTDYERIKDFAKYPEHKFLNENYLLVPILFAVTLFLLGGWSALIWGFFVSTVFLYHGTFVINSLAHKFGKRRYPTTDDSRNSLILALITMGEGWHNNHHFYQASVRQGFYWWEIDMSYYVLKFLSFFGVVWNLKAPPEWVYERAIESKGIDISYETVIAKAAELAQGSSPASASI